MSGPPAPLFSLDYRTLVPEGTAIFLDFDGTLAEIAADPDAVSLHPDTRGILERLALSCGGAVAIVTGRAIEDIDRFLSPLKLPVAGVHGLERRASAGSRFSSDIDAADLEIVRGRLALVSAARPGTVLETKPGSVALHYRRRPDLAEDCIAAAHHAVEDLDGVEILHGKMVVEVKAGKATKASAVADFMAEPPFAGRLPIFAGDDVTDEHAFLEISARRGISIKIGMGDTAASYRAAGTEELRDWLSMLADGFETARMAE